jgi:hypothetical protein
MELLNTKLNNPIFDKYEFQIELFEKDLNCSSRHKCFKNGVLLVYREYCGFYLQSLFFSDIFVSIKTENDLQAMIYVLESSAYKFKLQKIEWWFQKTAAKIKRFFTGDKLPF